MTAVMDEGVSVHTKRRGTDKRASAFSNHLEVYTGSVTRHNQAERSGNICSEETTYRSYRIRELTVNSIFAGLHCI